MQASHSSEEVLALKKEIARCLVEADKLRTAIALNKVCRTLYLAMIARYLIAHAVCSHGMSHCSVLIVVHSAQTSSVTSHSNPSALCCRSDLTS